MFPKLLIRVCLLSAGILAGLLSCEIVTRFFFAESIKPRLMRDSGFGIRDNQTKARAHHSSPGEYSIDISTNSNGLRGTKEYTRALSPGVRRIAILGDSFAFGYGCTDDQVVSAVLERNLNAQAAAHAVWEVPNFAVSGFGQAEELILYRAKVQYYNPETVVLFYFDNDIGNNLVAGTFALATDGTVHETGKSYLPGVALRQSMYTLPPIRYLFLHSQAWNLIRNRLSAIVQQHQLRGVGLENYSQATAAGVALTRALLLELNKEITSNGSRLIVVVTPDINGRSSFPFTSNECQALGIDTLDGSKLVNRSDYYLYDGHWRPSGHSKVAEALLVRLNNSPLNAARSHTSMRSGDTLSKRAH